MNHYSTDLTDNQWQVIEKFLDVQVRKHKYSLRSIVNAINYLLKTGCQLRMLPKDFPPYNLVYYYFSKWENEGVFEKLFIEVHIWLRFMLGCTVSCENCRAMIQLALCFLMLNKIF